MNESHISCSELSKCMFFISRWTHVGPWIFTSSKPHAYWKCWSPWCSRSSALKLSNMSVHFVTMKLNYLKLRHHNIPNHVGFIIRIYHDARPPERQSLSVPPSSWNDSTPTECIFMEFDIYFSKIRRQNWSLSKIWQE